jgi:FtsP/CotA-like multicopper oxidase with cupredoxin domain
VARGLFGALVVLPRSNAHVQAGLDLTVISHAWQTPDGPVAALGTADTRQHRTVAPGTPVRLRLVNTSNNTANEAEPATFSLTGTSFRVSAIDGTDLVAPTELDGIRLPLATGGRYDLAFTMPHRPVLLADLANADAGLLLTPDGGDSAPRPAASTLFDPSTYGQPAPTPFDLSSRFDRQFRLILGDGAGFFNGQLNLWTTINGRQFPDTPTLMVQDGDLVKVKIVSRSGDNHPMHLHGHHALVLTRNGRPTTGSPWWTDTLDVRPGETFEIAFRADNPGLWMDHCHNLEHAAEGMTMHLAYAGITTPYQTGHSTRNQPE